MAALPRDADYTSRESIKLTREDAPGHRDGFPTDQMAYVIRCARTVLTDRCANLHRISRVDGLVDGTHPNDLGFQWMAEGLAERLRKVLGLQAISASPS